MSTLPPLSDELRARLIEPSPSAAEKTRGRARFMASVGLGVATSSATAVASAATKLGGGSVLGKGAGSMATGVATGATGAVSAVGGTAGKAALGAGAALGGKASTAVGSAWIAKALAVTVVACAGIGGAVYVATSESTAVVVHSDAGSEAPLPGPGPGPSLRHRRAVDHAASDAGPRVVLDAAHREPQQRAIDAAPGPEPRGLVDASPRPPRREGVDAAQVAAPARSEEELIAAVMRARDHDPAAAEKLLREHAKSYPSGDFSEDREAIWVDLLIRRGATEQARSKALNFVKRYPRSVHLEDMLRVVEEP